MDKDDYNVVTKLFTDLRVVEEDIDKLTRSGHESIPHLDYQYRYKKEHVEIIIGCKQNILGFLRDKKQSLKKEIKSIKFTRQRKSNAT